jgi:hypothetical protein
MISAMRFVPGRKTGRAARGLSSRNAPGPEASTAATNLRGRLSRVKGKAGGWRRLLMLALLALIAACAGPTPRPQTRTGTGAIVQEMPSLHVSVEAEAWNGQPRNLPEYILPFLVILQNTGTAPVAVTRADFFLLDDANRQYLPLAPSEVVTLLGGRASGVGVSPSVGVSGSTAGSTSVGVGLGILLGGYGADTRDVIPLGLPEGPILPGAEVKGFLYFPHPAPGYKGLRFVLAPQALPGKPRLDFEFRRPGS